MSEGYKDSVFGKIPITWNSLKLVDVLSKSPEYGANASAKEFDSNSFRYIRITDILENGKLTENNFVGISIKEGESYKLIQDDILIARTGNTVGKSYLYDIKDGECSFAGYLIRFKINKTISTPKYIIQYLHSELFWNWVKSIVRTGAQPNINSKEYQSLPIPLPPLPEQQKIAEILSTVDAKIEVIDQQITETQELKKGLMQRLLTKGIGHTEFKDSPLGEIPKSWEVVRFGDTLTQSPEYGANASAKEYDSVCYRYIRITDILENGRLTTSNYVGISIQEGKQYELTENDILIARTGNTVGKSYLYQNEDGLCSFAGYLIRFRCDEKRLNPKFIFQFLHSDVFWNWVKSIVRTGAQPNINSKEYQSMQIPLPNIFEQQKIVEILSSVDAKLEVLSEKKTHYQELKQGLMQQLLTGKVRVSVNEKIQS